MVIIEIMMIMVSALEKMMMRNVYLCASTLFGQGSQAVYQLHHSSGVHETYLHYFVILLDSELIEYNSLLCQWFYIWWLLICWDTSVGVIVLILMMVPCQEVGMSTIETWYWPTLLIHELSLSNKRNQTKDTLKLNQTTNQTHSNCHPPHNIHFMKLFSLPANYYRLSPNQICW